MGDTLSRFIAASVEFIVGGILLGTSLLLCVIQFPGVRAALLATLEDGWISKVSDGALAVFGLCMAYAVGVFAESSSRIMLEGKLDEVTRQKFSSRETQLEAQDARERARLKILLHRPHVYREIESQLRRMRLERIWFLSLTLVGASSLVHLVLVRNLTWVGVFAVTVLILVVSYRVVNERFHRFCTAIRELERGLTDLDEALSATGEPVENPEQ